MRTLSKVVFVPIGLLVLALVVHAASSCGGSPSSPSTAGSPGIHLVSGGATEAPPSIPLLPPTPIAGISGGQPDTAAGLQTAAKSQQQALLSGDIKTAYADYAKACRDQVSYIDFAGTVAVADLFVQSFLKIKFSDIEVASVEVSNFTSGGGDVLSHWRAKADPTLSLDSSSNKPATWIYEAGRWALSDCSGMKFTSNASPIPTIAHVPAFATATPHGSLPNR